MDHHEDNICNRRLLALVARGNAIITELHRLIELVPSPYKCTGESERVTREDRFALDDIIYDFSYFDNSQFHENKIETNAILKKADEKFCDSFIAILTRFYLTFESVQRYSSDLNNFIVELEEESFVGQSLDGLLIDIESRQLLCEAYFLLGYMLITVDNNFEGGLRERLIVSYYRYSSYKSLPGSNLDETCNLMRSTGFRSTQQKVYRSHRNAQLHRPESYPETFFGRVKVNQSVISLLVAKLQSTDIYDQAVLAFPHPDHRSTALSQQASMLYVILYFCPNILHNQRARMREIIDKFFFDNWIISLHMGELVNLVEAWEPYKAAKESLNQLIEAESIVALINQNKLKFHTVSKQLREYLKEGWLDEKSVLENHVKMVNQMREANVLLRWFMLHSQLHSDWQSKLTQSMYSMVIKSAPTRELLFGFLQDLSELEKKFVELFDNNLANRGKRIEKCKSDASETLDDLIDIFSDTKPMRWIQPGANTKLVNLLREFSSNLHGIDFDRALMAESPTSTRDSVINLINDIQSAQESYLSGKNLQTIQLFKDTQESLMLVLKFISLTDDVKVSIRSISNFSYAWRIMDVTFTAHMQKMIKDNPLKVYGIESTFLKLASAFDTCLLRLRQNNLKDDLDSVSQYYSRKLVSYMRDVLHIIPESILELVSLIIDIQTEHFMRDMPAKVSLDNLKDYALPDQRFKMLELTHKISHYAESMLMMQNTTLGSIKINSKQLLEDGIRRELVKRMSDSIRDVVRQSNPKSPQSLLLTLKRLDTIMNGYKCSFNYLQDYLFIYGLRMWQEELSRIIKFNVELATEGLMREWCSRDGGYQASGSLSNHGSIYQSSIAPVPVYSSDPLESSFIALIFSHLLRATDPRATIYDEQMNAWYDQRGSHDKIVDLEVFELLASSLSVAGLAAVDQMCCVLILAELQKLDAQLMGSGCSNQDLVRTLSGLCDSSAESQQNGGAGSRPLEKSLSSAQTQMAAHNERVVNHLLRVGQLQAIRTSISCVLSTKCRYEARDIYNCLSTLNSTLLAAVKETSQQNASDHSASSSGSSSSSEDWELDESPEEAKLQDSQLIVELANHLEWIGLSEPLGKIYTLSLQNSDSSKAVDLVFLVLLDQCSKLEFSRLINGLVPKQARSFYEASHTVDGQPLFYGLVTLMNHYEPSGLGMEPLKRLLNLISCYVRWCLGKADTTSVGSLLMSLLELIRLTRQPADELLSDLCLPKFIFDTFESSACHQSKA